MLRWIEGFELFDGVVGDVVDSAINEKYDIRENIDANVKLATGRVAGFGLEGTAGSFPKAMRRTLPGGTHNRWFMGIALNAGGWVDGRLIFGTSSGGSNEMTVRMVVSGGNKLGVYRGGTLIGTTGTTFSTSTWYYLELYVHAHATQGAYELRVDGVNVLSATNVDTVNLTDQTQDFVIAIPAGATTIIDDVYCCDDKGVRNNNFLGIQRVIGLLPDAAGDSTQWTPDTGNNFERVDEDAPDGDGSYVDSNTAGNKDLYNFAALPAGSFSIKGVQVNLHMKAIGASRTVIPKVKHSTSEGDADPVVISGATYFNRQGIFETNPSTGSPWFTAEVNAMQAGLELES